MARGRGESLSEKIGLLIQIQRQDWSSKERQFGYQPDELIEMAQEYDKRIEAIEKSREYSGLGKDNKKNEVVIETFGKLSKWAEKTLSGLDTHIETLRTAIRTMTLRPPPKDSNEAILVELRRQEIRRAFKKLDDIQIEMLFLSSSPEIRDAMATSPPVIRENRDGQPTLEPLVRAEVVDRVLLAEAEAAAGPEKVSEIRELQAVREKFEAVIALARSELRKQTHLVLTESPETAVAMKGQ